MAITDDPSKGKAEVLTLLLEQVDVERMKARDFREWRLVHAKSRSVLTRFGELRIRRRFYRNVETGEAALPSMRRWASLPDSGYRTG